jgi:hypothetical protein
VGIETDGAGEVVGLHGCDQFRELAGVRPGNLKELASVHDE